MQNKKTMALYKLKKELQEQILYWEKFQGVNWLGKWSRSIRLIKLKKELNNVENEILELKHKNK